MSLFQSSSSKDAENSQAAKKAAAGAKRAPLENIGNRAEKKLAVEKEAVKVAVPTQLEQVVEETAAAVTCAPEVAAVTAVVERAAQPPAPVEAAPHPVLLALPEGVLDIDTPDENSPEFAVEYVTEIYEYLAAKEVRLALEYGKGGAAFVTHTHTHPFLLWVQRTFHVGSAYLSGGNFTASMRAVLLEWLVQVHHRCALAQETLYLTMHVLDRYMSVKSVAHDRIQLVGVAALLIASKYEDTFSPRLSKLCTLCENVYTKEELILMEGDVLSTLDFDLGCPVSLQFLRRGSRVRFVFPAASSSSLFVSSLIRVGKGATGGALIPPSLFGFGLARCVHGW